MYWPVISLHVLAIKLKRPLFSEDIEQEGEEDAADAEEEGEDEEKTPTWFEEKR